MMPESRYKNYKANEDRINLKDGILFRKSFGETGSVKYYQILIPQQIVNEILCSLHGEFGKHPGMAKTSFAYRGRHHFPKNGAVNQGKGHVMRAMHQRPPCKIPMNPSLQLDTPCKLIWCRNYRRPVALKIL